MVKKKTPLNNKHRTGQVTKDMTFGELMELDSEAGMKLAERGLFCGGCPMAQFERIGDGAKAHGVDVVQLLGELNKDTALPKDTKKSLIFSKETPSAKDTLVLKNAEGSDDG